MHDTSRADFVRDSPHSRAFSKTLPLYTTYFVFFFALWVLLPLVEKQVPGDNYEQLHWALSPALGYSKHPPFPTWVLWLFEQAFPATVLLTYVLGALQVAFLLTMTWLITRDVLDRSRALLAVLMVSCITYYTHRMHFYNHNTALLVATGAAVYALWRAVRTNSVWWWLALGICWGIGMLSKYQMAVTIACNGAYLISIARSRRDLWRGAAFAAAIASLMVLPHAVWLAQNHFPTFDYASKSLGACLGWFDRPARIGKFLADQALRLVNLFLLMIALTLLTRRNGVTGTAAASHEGRRFLAIHAFGPLIFMTLLSALFGVELQMHWGTAFLWAIPVWIVATDWGARVSKLDRKLVLGCAAGAQVVMVLGFVLNL